MGKNNRKLIAEGAATRNPKYGIRKLSVGVASVAVGALLSMGMTTVDAEEVIASEVIEIEEVIVEEPVEVVESVVEPVAEAEPVAVVEEVVIEEAASNEQVEDSYYESEEVSVDESLEQSVEESVETSHEESNDQTVGESVEEEIYESEVESLESQYDETESEDESVSPESEEAYPYPDESDENYEEPDPEADVNYHYNGVDDFNELQTNNILQAEMAELENRLENNKSYYEQYINNNLLTVITREEYDRVSTVSDDIIYMSNTLKDIEQHLEEKYIELDNTNDYTEIDLLYSEIGQLNEQQAIQTALLDERSFQYDSVLNELNNIYIDQDNITWMFSEVLNQKNQLNDLNNQLKELNITKEKFEQEFIQIKEIITEEEYRQLENKLNSYENEFSNLMWEIKYHHELQNESHSKIAESQANIDYLNLELDNHYASRQITELVLQEKNNAKNLVEAELSQATIEEENYLALEMQYETLQADISILIDELNHLSMIENDIYWEIQNHNNEIERISQDLTASNERLVEINKDIISRDKHIQFYNELYFSFEKEVYLKELISIGLNKNEYEVGETAELIIELLPDNLESQSHMNINASFYSDESNHYLRLNGYTSSMEVNDQGNYVAKIDIELPINYPSQLFKLSSVSLNRDGYYLDVSEDTDSRIKDITINLNNSNPDTVDVDSPNINSISLEEGKYNVGDTVKLEIKLLEKNLIKEIRASLRESEESQQFRLDNQQKALNQDLAFSFRDIELNGDEQTIHMEFTIPENFPNLELLLSQIMIEDQYGNSTYLSEYDFEYNLPSFNVENTRNPLGDLDGPEIINIYTDKTAYEASEEIRIHLEVNDLSELDLDNISGYFVRHSGGEDYKGPQFLYVVNPIIESITTNQAGNQELILNVGMPANIRSGVYQLDHLNITDKHNNLNDGIGNTSYQKRTINIIQRDSTKNDVEGPEFVNLELDKLKYEVGDTGILHIELSDENHISNVILNFSNGRSDVLVEAGIKDFALNQFGNYEANIPIELTPYLKTGEYTLGYTRIEDINGNWRFGNLAVWPIYFEIENNSKLSDTDLIRVDVENNILSEGESTQVIVELSHPFEINEVELLFQGQENQSGPSSNTFTFTANEIIQNTNGNFEAIFDIQLPKSSMTNIYKLSSINYSDSYRSKENLSEYDSNIVSSKVVYHMNPIVEAESPAIKVVKDIILDKEYYSEGETAQVILEVESNDFINFGQIEFDISERNPFQGRLRFGNIAEFTDVKQVDTNLYHLKFEIPIQYPDGIDNLYIYNLNTIDINGSVNYNVFYKNHVIKLQRTKQEVSTELVPFEIKRIPYTELAVGEEMVVQEGFNGQKNVFYDVTYHKDTVLGRTFASEEITQGPIHQIILVGTAEESKEETGKEETITKVHTDREVIPYEIIYIENSSLSEGVENILIEGENGFKEITHSITIVKIDGVEVSRNESTDKTITNAVNQIVEIGTKVETEEDIIEEDIDENANEDNGSGNIGDVDPGLEDTEQDEEQEEEQNEEQEEQEGQEDEEDKEEQNQEGIVGEESNSEDEADYGNDEPSEDPKDEEAVITPELDYTDTDKETIPENLINDIQGLDSSKVQASAVTLLPATGEVSNSIWIGIGISGLIAGMGLLVGNRKNEEV